MAKRKTLVALSILACDFSRLGAEVERVSAAGANLLVAGTSIFRAGDAGGEIALLRKVG